MRSHFLIFCQIYRIQLFSNCYIPNTPAQPHQLLMASLLKKGGAGKSLPGNCAEDASNAVANAVEQLAQKYGVDLHAKEEKREEDESDVAARYDAAAAEFRRKEAETRANANRGTGKFISQKTFDDVVAENIEDFEMEPEEAAKDAVEQFESQGVDLSNIVKTSGGANSGPVPDILTRLESSSDVASAVSAMQDLKKAVEMDDNDFMIASTSDATGMVFGAVGRINKSSLELVTEALLTFVVLQKYGKGLQRDVIPLYPVAKPVLRMVFEMKELRSLSLWSLACRVTRLACAKNEDAKKSMYNEYGLDTHVRTAIRRGLGWSQSSLDMTGASHEYITSQSTHVTIEGETTLEHRTLLRESCLLLSTLLLDDDRRERVQPNTFNRGRNFGDGKRIGTTCIGEIVEVLKISSNIALNDDELNEEESINGRKFAGDIAISVRCLAVTDEICADFTDRGATEMLISLLDVYIDDARVCSRCCLALKMISNNDANKRTLVLKGGLDVVLRAMSNHSIVAEVQSQCTFPVVCLSCLILFNRPFSTFCKLLFSF